MPVARGGDNPHPDPLMDKPHANFKLDSRAASSIGTILWQLIALKQGHSRFPCVLCHAVHLQVALSANTLPKKPQRASLRAAHQQILQGALHCMAVVGQQPGLFIAIRESHPPNSPLCTLCRETSSSRSCPTVAATHLCSSPSLSCFTTRKTLHASLSSFAKTHHGVGHAGSRMLTQHAK
jgi:hypothetical protein